MVRWQPIYRKVPPQPIGQPFTVEPEPNFDGCVLVEKIIKEEEPVARLRLYVGNSPSQNVAKVEYTPKTAGSYWIVDIPMNDVVDLDEILVAIANGTAELPDPPIIWGNR